MIALSIALTVVTFLALDLWLTAWTPEEGEPRADLGRPRRDPLASSPSSGVRVVYVFSAPYDTERDMDHVPDVFPEEWTR